MQTQNLQIAPVGVRPIIHVSQFDVGRQFKFNLYDGETAYSMPGGTTAIINGIKPDKHGFSYNDAVSVSGNVATITTTEQMTVVEGSVECEIRFVKGEDDIGTLNFTMIVEKSPINGDTDISETEIPAIVELARAEMEAAADSAEDAEAYAVGTRGGVPVTSGDPTYENNAKYYSDKLGDDVDAAKNAAKDSEAYAVGKRGGVDVSSDDPAYHNNSKYYAGQASSSASSAGSAADRAEAAVVNEPYIGANGNWFVYDFQTQQYVDTNVDATGPAGADGQDGATGNGIASITKTGTSGLVDTYTILYTNGQSTTFTVTNGANGTGSGDMMQADYDANSTVKNAGGIVAYVAAQISGTSLSGLTDVDLTNLAAGQTLKYNATSQKWENTSLATVATSGSYSDLSNKPTLGTAAAKDSTNAVTQNSTDLVESGAVYSEVSSLNSALSNKQPKTLDTPLTIGGSSQTTVEGALGGLNTEDGKAYKTDDTTETTLASDDVLPFYDTSATAKRKMTVQKFGEQLISNPNLLDNPWFTVNQRGATSLPTEQYGVDRWRGIYDIDANGCIDLSATHYLYEILEDDLRDSLDGKTVTASILYSDGLIESGTLIYDKAPSSFVNIIVSSRVYCQLMPSTGAFAITAKGVIVTDDIIRAVKLEVGEVSTLAMDTAPNYAEELLKCQRYFQAYHFAQYDTIAHVDASANNAQYYLPALEMRATPTVTIDGTIGSVAPNSENITASSITGVYRIFGGYLAYGPRNTSGTIISGYIFASDASGVSVALSADL